jgi:hypothetical protein
LAAVDSSIEEDRGRNVMNTIRAATAIVIRIMAPLLFGRDCAWCVKSSVEVIGCSPFADLRTQIERAALRRYFSLGKNGYDCRRAAKHPAKTTRQAMKLTYKFAEMTPEKRPQDPSLDGTGLIFETLEHSGESFRSVSPDSPLHASSLARTNFRFGSKNGSGPALTALPLYTPVNGHRQSALACLKRSPRGDPRHVEFLIRLRLCL